MRLLASASASVRGIPYRIAMNQFGMHRFAIAVPSIPAKAPANRPGIWSLKHAIAVPAKRSRGMVFRAKLVLKPAITDTPTRTMTKNSVTGVKAGGLNRTPQ